jgi:subtilisin family serine protease
MHRFAVAVLIVAVASGVLAQFVPDSRFHIEKSDGTEITFPSMTDDSSGTIIEFFAPPVAATVHSAAKTAVDYQATFTRFRTDLETILNRNGSAKAAVDASIRRSYFVAFNGVAVDVPADAVAQIRLLPYVKRVASDRTMRALADGPNTSLIRADKVWSTLGSRGKGVTVAIIDTGVDYMHPALGGGFGAGFKVAGGWDFVNNDADPLDDNGHGTHVAGIVAGQSDLITGVAPDATLIAYKVLGANGSGKESDVMAALERAADPNQDGNTNDHVDVANLSLGGAGSPDDPQSEAIDNATAAGVTFAIAAGNSGSGFHTIASPGTARNAITVGASDGSDVVASFSSRGPNMKNIAIKPDVLAPGVSIMSSYLNGRYAVLSGTSMATPHVTGAAALLKSLHHDWTPAQIKLALMNNATQIHDEIMAVGAGRIDVYAAATGTLAVDPPAISLGLEPPAVGNWTATRSLHLTNSGTKPVSFAVTSNVTIGEKVTPSPATVTVPAGGSADLSLAFAVDNSIATSSAASFTGGGQIVLTNTASAADVRNIQFAFTKSARATVTFDRAYPDAIWINNARSTMLSASYLDDQTSEVLMLPGSWDMVIYTTEAATKTGSPATADVVTREALSVTTDMTIPLTLADVPHVITYAGRKETGEGLAGIGYASSGRIYLGGQAGPFASLSFPWNPVHTMHVSDISAGKTLLLYETLLDPVFNNYYMIQHPPLTGVSADASLTTGGSALRGAAVQIAIPPAAQTDRRLKIWAATPTLSGTSFTSIVNTPVVNAHVYVSPDVYPGVTYGIAFSAIADNITQYTTPLLRVTNDRLVSLGTASLLPWTYSGSTFEYGLGPRFPVSGFAPTAPLKLNSAVDLVGPLGELRVTDRAGTTTTLFDANGNKLLTFGYLAALDLSAMAAFRIEAKNQGTLNTGVEKTTTVSMSLDSSRSDYIPPTLTTMTMLDGSGAIVTRLEPHGSGSLLFSAADFGLNASGSRIYQPINGDSTAVSYRYAGETAWRPLPATQIQEDAADSAGILYRVDLTPVTNVDRNFVDLKIDLADAAGNTTTITMAPAFSVGPELGPKRRATK